MNLQTFILILLIYIITIPASAQQWQYSGGTATFSGNVGIGTTNPIERFRVTWGSGSVYLLNGNNGIGNLLGFNGVNGSNLTINSYTPVSGHLKTTIGVNYAVDGNNGYTHYAQIGAKKSPMMLLDADNGSVSLYGENGTGGDFRFSQLNLGVTVAGNGYTGIGVAAPEKNLHIKAAGEVEALIETTADNFSNLTFKSNNKRWQWSKRDGTNNDILALFFHDGSAWSAPIFSFTPTGNIVHQPTQQHGTFRIKSGVNGGSVLFDFADHPDLGNSSYGYLGLSNHTDWGAPVNSLALISTRMGTKATKDIMIWANDQPTASNVSMLIKANSGKVGIGTSDVGNGNFKLYVADGIRTRKVKVDQDSWADYVFKKGYRLRSLDEVEKFIQQNQHLPEVPSEAEVKKEGVDLGDNQVVLLKKIEELTLYVIDLNNKLQEEKRSREALQNEVKRLQGCKQ